jgi:hypothetical protein
LQFGQYIHAKQYSKIGKYQGFEIPSWNIIKT